MTHSTQQLVVGWLSGVHGSCWPGVLLHHDAMLAKVPRALLESGSVDMEVLVDTGGPVLLPVRIAEIRLLDVGGQPADPATAMIRLADDPGVRPTVRINRDGFGIALRVTDDVWEAVGSLGLLPHREPDIPRLPTPRLRPPAGPIPVRPISVQPDGGCDIFWWLC